VSFVTLREQSHLVTLMLLTFDLFYAFPHMCIYSLIITREEHACCVVITINNNNKALDGLYLWLHWPLLNTRMCARPPLSAPIYVLFYILFLLLSAVRVEGFIICIAPHIPRQSKGIGARCALTALLLVDQYNVC
jgi:hypothetical protein